ncbi:MAG: hypothetical protein AB7V13_21130 [Pseudorhodoplanes sp.]|uniref:hypothetical protein n=1 Tax=Pseudorhodoplanes sp. TaxID=1934341 RepID=UPI003D0C6AD6
MSAVNVIVQRDRACIVSDGAKYDAAGILKAIGPKCVSLPHLPALIASRGACEALPILQYHATWRFPTFDHLIAGIEVTVAEIMETYDFDSGISPEQQFTFVGWSEARGRFAAFGMVTHDITDGVRQFAEDTGGNVAAVLAAVPEPMKLIEFGDDMCAPVLPDDVAEAIFSGCATIDDVDPAVDGLKILEAQRQLKVSGRPGWPAAHHVGGFALLSTVTRDGVTERIIHRWNEDRIGEPIRPAAPFKPAIAPARDPLAGMSRLQRDILRRKQRKAARR